MKESIYKRKAVRLGALMTAFVMAASFAVWDASEAAGAGQQTDTKTVSTTDTIKTGNNTITLNGCVKGKEYILSVVKGSVNNYSIRENTVLYINQKTAEGTSLKFSFPVSGSAGVVVLVSSNDGAGDYPIVIGEANIPISQATIKMKDITYNGKALQAAVESVVYGGKNYSVSASCTAAGEGKSVGTYTATVTGKGSFVGTVTKKFNIVPVGTSLKSVKKGKKKMTVKWKKPAKKYKKQIAGYQIQYSLNEDFTDAKIVSGGKYTKKSKTIKGLKPKTKYYVRIRTYKGSCYSAWSKMKSVTVK